MASKKRRQSGIPTALSAVSKKSKSSIKEDVYTSGDLLCQLTRSSGLTLMKGTAQNKLEVTKVAFQTQLSKALKSYKGDLFQNIESMVQEFEEYIKDSEQFHKSLTPCTFTGDASSFNCSVPESTVRLLLGVEVMQSPMMSMLLDKLLECLGDKTDYVFHMGQKIHIPRLLLSQFRFLDRIVDGKELTKKLLEVLQGSSAEVQKEIIACLPDIVEDSEHGEVARALRDELVSNKQLTCAVIDALTYLSIPPDLILEVRTSVVDMLKGFHLCDLPIVVNFLLETCSAKDSLEIVNEIRSNLAFSPSPESAKKDSGKLETDIKLIIEALKGRMQFQRYIADSWIKAIDSAKDARVLDVFVLLVLHWMSHKKSVESLMRNRIRAGLIDEGLLTTAFHSPNTQVLREYFPSILSLAQTLLRSSEPNICQIGCLMYKLAFQNFDAYSQQEIVGQLVSHMGSGSSGEVDASLDILSDLVNTQLQAMTRYAVFVKGVLDYLDHNNLSVAQIRKLYLLLAKLAFRASHDGGYLQDDLHIIIRKQLTGVNLKYKKMGVMGAVSVVVALGTAREEGGDLTSEEFKLVTELLELVQTSGQDDPETEALFLDSLASVMGSQSLAGNLEDWVDEHMTRAFEDSYVVDLEEGPSSSVLPLATESVYDLNSSEGVIGVDIIALARTLYTKAPPSEKRSAPSPLCLCPLFHLLTSCTKRHSDSGLEDIAAVLGCPVMLPSRDVCQRLASLPAPQDRDVVCSSLFLAVNWFREVINSFGPMDNAEMKGKVMLRLKHITELNDLLEKCLVQHPTFQPPPVTFDMDTPSAAAGSKVGVTVEKKRAKKAGKGKKGKENSAESQSILSQIDAAETQESQAKSQTADGKGEDKRIELSKYRPYFRELDLQVFSILKAGLISRAALDTELNTRVTEEIQMNLPELEFLLEDLSVKLNHALLASSASKRRNFLKPRGDKEVGFAKLELHSAVEVAEHVVEILPCLCRHLEEICGFFQALIDGNDGVEDGPGRGTPEAVRMAACYHLLLQCILSLFSWTGFGSEANKALYRKALSVLVARMVVASQEDSCSVSQRDALKSSFQYFGNLVATVPSLEGAVTLLKLLMALAHRCQDTACSPTLVKYAKTFLNKEWRGTDNQLPKGAKHNEQLQMVIKTYITYSSDPFQALEELTTQGLADMDSSSREEFASLNRSTFSTYYKVVQSELITCVKQVPVGRARDPQDVQEDLLLSWLKAVKVLHTAVKLTKIFPARSNLMSALKGGRQFVEIFLRQGMPLMDITFRRHPTEVQNLLRLLQGSTRTLHHLCGHSKITKDISMTNQVPMLKRSLEAFVYRVKAMLTLNNCQEAFWIGNLKNRDLQGQEILTQTSIASSGNAEGSDDNNENDDDDDEEGNPGGEESEDSEVEMTGRPEETVDSNADVGSYSEVF